MEKQSEYQIPIEARALRSRTLSSALSIDHIILTDEIEGLLKSVASKLDQITETVQKHQGYKIPLRLIDGLDTSFKAVKSCSEYTTQSTSLVRNSDSPAPSKRPWKRPRIERHTYVRRAINPSTVASNYLDSPTNISSPYDNASTTMPILILGGYKVAATANSSCAVVDENKTNDSTVETLNYSNTAQLKSILLNRIPLVILEETVDFLGPFDLARLNMYVTLNFIFFFRTIFCTYNHSNALFFFLA